MPRPPDYRLPVCWHEDSQTVFFERWQCEQYNVPSAKPLRICNSCGFAENLYASKRATPIPDFVDIAMFTGPFNLEVYQQETEH